MPRAFSLSSINWRTYCQLGEAREKRKINLHSIQIRKQTQTEIQIRIPNQIQLQRRGSSCRRGVRGGRDVVIENWAHSGGSTINFLRERCDAVAAEAATAADEANGNG